MNKAFSARAPHRCGHDDLSRRQCRTGQALGGKDMTKIMAAHGIPYVAQASPSHWSDLMKKVKALSIEGRNS
ncbi:MAG: hypothetical protein MZV70_12530 [Desulfobacterales bacterium]|nr:hypothetical protein [Desulfobacterales bacterium]